MSKRISNKRIKQMMVDVIVRKYNGVDGAWVGGSPSFSSGDTTEQTCYSFFMYHQPISLTANQLKQIKG